MNVITVKTQNNFRICEIMKVTYRNKHHKPAPLSTCGARHCTLHRHSGPQQQYLAYHIKNRPIKVLALSIAPTKMSYRHTGQTQRIFKAFWGFRRLRTLPTGSRPLAGKHKEILLMGNGLEETVVSTRTSTFCTIWSMPLCAYESFWSSLKKKKKIWADRTSLKMESNLCFCKAAENQQWNHLQHGKTLSWRIWKTLPQIASGLVRKKHNKILM